MTNILLINYPLKQGLKHSIERAFCDAFGTSN